jgi:pimeloyl-ACP methyl ester carboxylesterase
MDKRCRWRSRIAHRRIEGGGGWLRHCGANRDRQRFVVLIYTCCVPVLTVDGAELAYEERGAGDPLVLVHGSGTQLELWGSAVDELSIDRRVIAYDRRGYGRSSHRPVRDYGRHVADAIDIVERVAGGPAVVVGHSSGASVALALAAERPELVRALILAEPPFHGLRYATGGLVAVIARAKFSQVRGRPRDGAASFFRWVTAYQTGGNAFDRLPVEWREMILGNARALLAELDPHPTGGLFEHRSMRSLTAIRAPITFVLGDLSQPWFHRCHAKLVGALAGTQTERIPGASHFVSSDAPAEFLAAVQRGAARAG